MSWRSLTTSTCLVTQASASSLTSVYSTCPFNCEKGHHSFRLPIDDQAPSFWEHNQSDTEVRDGFKKWIVTRDCSVKLTYDEQLLLPHDHSASDIEFASRILDFNNPSPCPHGQHFPCTDQPLIWDWKTEVSTIIETVKRACNKPGWRVWCCVRLTSECCALAEKILLSRGSRLCHSHSRHCPLPGTRLFAGIFMIGPRQL